MSITIDGVKYLYREEVETVLNRSHRTVYRMAKSGELPQPIYVGRRRKKVFREQDVLKAKKAMGYLIYE